jgi:hypothetical protein
VFRAPFLILALLAAPALGQSTQIVTWEPGNQERFNAADCESSAPLTFTWDTAGAGGAYDFYVTYEFDGDCDPADNNILSPDNGEGIPIFELVSQPAGQLYTEDTTADIFLPSEACFSGPARNTVGVMCFTLYETALTDPRSRVDVYARNVIYDTSIPLTPVLKNLVASDGAVSFDAVEAGGADLDDGPVEILAQIRGCDADAAIPTDFEEVEGSAPSTSAGDAGPGCDGPFFEKAFSSTAVSFNGLSTSSDYEVRAVARDDFGNRSPPSEITLFNPIAEIGPLSTYTGTGTPYDFNCAQSSGGSAASVGLALLALLGLRRRRAGALLVLALLVGSTAANAQAGRVTADLFAGPYLPNLDADPGANGMYSCFFDDQLLPEFGGDVTIGLFDKFGSLELGIGLSVAQVSGKTFNRDSLVNDPSCNSATATGRSQLSMLKLRPQIAYRFDWLLDEYNVPLVPYGELAFVGQAFAFTRNGAFDDGSDAPAAGAVFGHETVLGLALELSFLDHLDPFTPNTAHRARARGSFLHPFVFAEAAFQEVDNFGGRGFVFSPRDVLLGTGSSMMLRFGVRLELP